MHNIYFELLKKVENLIRVWFAVMIRNTNELFFLTNHVTHNFSVKTGMLKINKIATIRLSQFFDPSFYGFGCTIKRYRRLTST